jgi:hypothetical protein
MRTTIDINLRVLREVKAIQERVARSMRSLISQLLADVLARRRASRRSGRQGGPLQHAGLVNPMAGQRSFE